MKPAVVCLLIATSALRSTAQGAAAPAQVPTHAIVMVGDSITAQGNWAQVLHRGDVMNWGIPGYTTGQLAWTFKDLMAQQPKICFLEGGINDLTLGVPPDRIYQNQVEAVAYFRARHVIPVLQSVIYKVGNPETNLVIRELNARLAGFCRTQGVDFIDLNAALASSGELRAELSTDGTHLKPEAYPLWATAVEAVLERYRL